MSRAVIVPADFDPAPSLARTPVRVSVSDAAPDGSVLGIPVGAAGEPPSAAGLDRAALSRSGFDGEVGQTLALPGPGGQLRVAVGVGDPKAMDAAKARDAAAAFARAAARDSHLALSLEGLADLAPDILGQACVEGILLARYSYDPLQREPAGTPLESVTLIAEPARHASAAAGAMRGQALARATMLTRDLANTPPAHLTAARLADLAAEIGPGYGLDVEVFDRDALVRLGCGGLIGVNGGSAEEPRMIRLTYQPPAGAAEDAMLRLALVGKGIMYDSGGLSLKPADAVHATMKNDMSGAAAVLASMSVLRELGCRTAVTGYLMCTDNLPSGTALRLGDVITIHGGTTVEVLNTDAEGRLVMADALVMAAEQRPDAIVDIATLTGACMRALGTSVAGVMGSSQHVIDQVLRSAAATGEPAWQLPLERRYRKDLDSDVADLKNMGGPNGGAITAALFLDEFTGRVPWAHVDIAGTAQVDKPGAWLPPGCSGFGARLLADLALNFTQS
jgi:leucyl aminopeptidase